MNPGWRVLDCINLEGALRYSRGQLVIRAAEDKKDTVVPLTQIAVVLVGIRTSISGAILQKFQEYDIALLVCDWRNVPVSGILPWTDHSRVGARHNAQANLSLPRKKQAWARVVTAKIYGQAKVLEAFQQRDMSTELLALSKSVRSGDPENKEAQAARKYWATLPPLPGFSRLPGMEDCGWNSALDYGYTLLRGYGIRAICGAGLSGTLGLFHHGRSNPFSLVDDLMEPFRPMVDQFVFETFEDNSGELTSDSKRLISSSLTREFSSGGKSLPTVFNEFAQQYGLYVEGKLTSLTVPRWEGQLNAEEGL